MTTGAGDASIGLVFKNCLVAAALYHLSKDRYDCSVYQVCKAFHEAWNAPPKGLRLGFVLLTTGWYSKDVQSSLLVLSDTGCISLVDPVTQGCALIIDRTSIGKLHGSSLTTFPLIAWHETWIENTSRRLHMILDRMGSSK